MLTQGQPFHIVLSGTAPRTPGTTIVNRAQVLGTDVDINLQNNSAESVTRVLSPDWSIAKSVSVPEGTYANPGDRVDYAVEAISASGDVDGVTLTDDLTHVLDSADFVSGSARLTIADDAAIVIDDPTGNILSAGPFLLPSGKHATLTYSVRLNADAWSSTLRNTVTGDGSAAPATCAVAPLGQECQTETPSTARVVIEKVSAAGQDSRPLDGAAFRILHDDAGSPGAALAIDTVKPSTVVGQFEAKNITPGFYWLEELKAPAGYELLPGAIQFEVKANGELLLTSGADSLISIRRNALVIADVRALTLPDAGGQSLGAAPFIVGGLLAGGSLLVAIRARQRKTRSMLS